ncbi:MAG: transcription elongation factor GreA [Bacteroidaceae bacterium]|nr:transcription elongation factor GreA [Bacteroidaceae bacterium]
MAYMTRDGYDKKMAELKHMEEVERPAASAAIAEAREKGDLSENSEYDAAKEAQGMLEMRIAVLKDQLSKAKIIDPTKLDTSCVQILSTVEMKNLTNGMQMRYTIVSETEADLRQGKISSATPIAQGLLGHKVGDKVSVTTPMGTLQLEILKITFE